MDSKKSKRKPNFSIEEITIITESVAEKKEILNSKLTNSVTNKLKNSVWEEIKDKVNAVGVAPRSLVEVKDKWKNLLSQAKRENSEFKRERGKTGGGPAPKPPSAATAKIIEEYQDTPSFSGLIGFETGDSLTDDLEEPSVLVQVEESEVHRPTLHGKKVQ
ncbi:myb/SANT-like DNA-binding domain-containing protein 4 [Nematostella vectensis]|uniref:myb/SANT-like DNA-binding domain-containing protein 4 n=1 Tax=Nematostella vectensis TaxID=45351 RepID=UPI002077885D|nr:myb/SANT-like DNA-binding domain-containing protein 4 [Nematostella vectensis]